MKQSHIYQRKQQNFSKTSQKVQQQSSIYSSTMITSTNNDTLQNVFKIMQYLITQQQKIQLYKQTLTQRSDFNPQALFFYVSRDQLQIDRKHILQLLEQNNSHQMHQAHQAHQSHQAPQSHQSHQTHQISQQQIKLYLNSYGYKEKFDYSAFINLIFPTNTQLLKYISVTGIKKYFNQVIVTQEVLCIFLLLLQEEIKLLEELENLKLELLPKITRKQIKNIMRIMKKNGQCHSQMEIQSQPYVKYEELKVLFKNLISKSTATQSISSKSSSISSSMPSARKSGRNASQKKQQSYQKSIYTLLQKNLSCIFRKLSMGKNNFINLEDLQFWLRPWARFKSINCNQQQINPSILSITSITSTSNILNISGINENYCDSSSNEVLCQQQHINVPLSHHVY